MMQITQKYLYLFALLLIYECIFTLMHFIWTLQTQQLLLGFNTYILLYYSVDILLVFFPYLVYKFFSQFHIYK